VRPIDSLSNKRIGLSVTRREIWILDLRGEGGIMTTGPLRNQNDGVTSGKDERQLRLFLSGKKEAEKRIVLSTVRDGEAST